MMRTIDCAELSFPYNTAYEFEGASMRDWFAGKALQGCMAAEALARGNAWRDKTSC